ncbi:nuclear transport factor 2 family protein [Plantactinospora veratri]|uniref:Nuclear transport factor 2 family protein n=1 Tax=Plantactinospora veratri TaxID=1436122 RepID=A0ABU7S6C3_9ACTN
MTINTNHSSVVTPVDSRPMLWQNWMALRNGDRSLVEEILAPSVVAHLPVPGGSPEQVRGRQALVAWVSGRHAGCPDAQLAVEVGPIIGPDLIAGRWKLTRAGDDPDSVCPHRIVVACSGVDILRVDGDRIVEYWSHDDSVRLDRCLTYSAA